jgi:F0F1-type ATP synthase membrane subunit b/b'
MKDALSKSALLCRLNISVWTARTLDSKTTKEVLQTKGAKSTAGRFNKSLLPNNEIIKKLRKNASLARNYNYKVTLPWGDNGARILRNTLYSEHTKKMGEYKSEHEKLVADFNADLQAAINRAKSELGALFDPRDYPTAQALEVKFAFDTHYEQIPEGNDFRVELAEEDAQRIRDEITQRKDMAVQEARVHVYTQLNNVVSHMAKTLKDPKAKFKNTLTGNVAELTKILDDLNIAGDMKLSQLGQQAAPLGDYNPDALRKDPAIRAQAATEADAVANDIKEVMDALNS